ncbi:MAG: hypothetical protein A2653_02295 [Candidatus Zambryskibacteria bacterium RIFCSPHIGHO2_01_FULL_43_25]|uniref:EamA domain-containing protein n=1 Tax=Candidatus Zambryskibacteria bacterium RIFCSPLOWO2_01_FULL_45_21 TaxID=1802761 RepID=A0A1G2U341_9BACT|nr:MAG: hypothetical protein A2653_02295 [Candidatus Zambryskibacteria bacterium RIFCSPHIGHO2_01_FULL_43_25]OHB01032.1 MAG: hypothetical protein A3E94_02475 [Candidatus Zambryskibacteria bacterium RIFCSPHIGHO2_12_FULL_44_12b]OHB03923.1 MAG: hypothetical protein A3B14_01155 [Candidatus Zambryskibacteria bacterium RIFCSPLOWO2_01_FULL_45_21]
MTDLYSRTILAGIFFGFWPLLMNRSGLNGNVASLVQSCVALTVIIPFAVTSGFQTLHTARIEFALAAGVVAVSGLLTFNSMLAKVTKEQVGMLFVMMIMVQVSLPVVYHMVQNGEYTLKQIVGVLAAFLAIFLLGGQRA